MNYLALPFILTAASLNPVITDIQCSPTKTTIIVDDVGYFYEISVWVATNVNDLRNKERSTLYTRFQCYEIPQYIDIHSTNTIQYIWVESVFSIPSWF